MMRLLLSLIFCLFGPVWLGFSQRVAIHQADESPQTQYAVGVLTKVLVRNNYTVTAGSAEYTIDLSIAREKLENEGYAIIPQGKRLTITGGDARGLIYGCLAVAEDMQNGVSLSAIKAQTEKPHLPFRAIKFDLPWDTYRHSYSLDQHVETCRDVAYWERFLDMMVKNRFNALSLWNLHPYTYMIRPKNFPEASPFTDAELAQWQTLHRAIFRMAKERAIDTYLIPFNIFVSPAFAKAHNVAMDNLEHNFFVNGDTSAIVKRYTRECVTQVLQEYPDLTGFGLTLGEGMGGMSPQQREDWMKETIIEGMRLANRKAKLVHRIPFSSTTGSLGITSIDTEKLTRRAIDEEGGLDFLEGPIWADLKYNWSHAHSTPKLIKVHGGKLYDTYFKPEPTKYKITWTARNEDFFCLRWGVPDFIRAHVAANSQAYVGGYFIGSETYIPAKDYFTKPGGPVDWTYAFERQWLFYKLWGRLLYNPATPDVVFSAEFTRRYGKGAATLLDAYALASSTPLRLAASFDFTWDFSLYSEGMMAHDAKKNVSYISVEQQITQPTLDPAYVSVTDYVKTQLAGGTFESTKITPPILASLLERDCQKALQLVKPINTSSNRSLQYEVADVQVWANLGLHLAEKLKAAIALQTYRLTGGEANKQAAIQHLEAALRYWDVVVTITRPLYNDMPLVHLTEQKGSTWAENNKLRFHWATLRPAVANDIEIARQAQYSASK
ncbi:hypothetical protein BH09BAC4_BH09BAC4_25460 [soil metagenome]